jgi:hypothetical protein
MCSWQLPSSSSDRSRAHTHFVTFAPGTRTRVKHLGDTGLDMAGHLQAFHWLDILCATFSLSGEARPHSPPAKTANFRNERRNLNIMVVAAKRGVASC